MLAKIFIILGLVAAAALVCLQVLGLMSGDETLDMLGKVLSVIAILGLTTGLISLVAGNKNKNSDRNSPPNSGPKF